MRLISESPCFYKRFLDPLFFAAGIGGALAMLFLPDIGNPEAPAAMRYLAALATLAAATYALTMNRRLADEVLDAGQALVVRRSGHEVRIPLENVLELSWSRNAWRTHTCSLELATPCLFGREVVFISIRRGFVTRIRPHAVIYERLALRIREARRQSRGSMRTR